MKTVKHKSNPESFCYRFLNKDQMINKTLGKILKESTPIGPEYITPQLLTIERNFKFPLKLDVVERIKDGRIQMRYSQSVKMPTALPFVLLQGENHAVVPVLFLDLYAKSFDPSNRILEIDPKKLYCLAESGYIASRLLLMTDTQLGSKFTSVGTRVYNSIFTRILNRIYALNTDKSKLDRVMFISSVFFLLNVLGKDPNKAGMKDQIINYALLSCNQPNGVLLREFLDEFSNVQPNPYADIGTFIQRLSQTIPGLAGLTVSNYLESFISTYGASMLMGLETLEYLHYNISSVVMGAYVNNHVVLDNMIGDDANKFYQSITSLF